MSAAAWRNGLTLALGLWAGGLLVVLGVTHTMPVLITVALVCLGLAALLVVAAVVYERVIAPRRAARARRRVLAYLDGEQLAREAAELDRLAQASAEAIAAAPRRWVDLGTGLGPVSLDAVLGRHTDTAHLPAAVEDAELGDVWRYPPALRPDVPSRPSA